MTFFATATGRTATRRQTRQVLDDLGADAAEVASALEQAGVRGLRANIEGCPVAVYLGAVVACDLQVRAVKVGRDTVTIVPLRRFSWRIVVALPEPVHEFVVAFDRGQFPNVLRSTEPTTSSTAQQLN